jgi:hypothetical protein
MLNEGLNFVIKNGPVLLPVGLLTGFILYPPLRRAGRLALRLLARPLLLFAIVAVVYDGTIWMQGGRGLVFTSLFQHWNTLSPRSLEAMRGFVSRTLHPIVWEQGVAWLLRLPAWFLLGVASLALAWFGRRREAVRIYIN